MANEKDQKQSTGTSKKYLAAAGTLFHRQPQRLDFVRNPHKAWAVLCTIALILFLAILGIDSWISLKLRDGTLTPPAPAAVVPPPIIDQTLLTQTAQTYANKAATLSLLASATPPVSDPAQP